MGLASALSVGGGVGIGFLLDDWLGSTPVLTFVGLAGGVALAIALTVREARKYL